MNQNHQSTNSIRPSKAMTKKLCYSLANWLYSKESTATHRDRYIMYYVLQMLIYQLFDTIVLLIIGLVLNKLAISVVVMSGFVLSRFKYKGYHAKTIKACATFSILLIGMLIIITPNIYVGFVLGYSFGWLIGKNRVKKIMSKIEEKLHI